MGNLKNNEITFIPTTFVFFRFHGERIFVYFAIFLWLRNVWKWNTLRHFQASLSVIQDLVTVLAPIRHWPWSMRRYLFNTKLMLSLFIRNKATLKFKLLNKWIWKCVRPFFSQSFWTFDSVMLKADLFCIFHSNSTNINDCISSSIEHF